MLDFSPGILKNGAQLNFANVADSRQTRFKKFLIRLDGQMDRVISKFAERVLSRFAFVLDDLEVCLQQLLDGFDILKKWTDDPEGKKITQGSLAVTT